MKLQYLAPILILALSLTGYASAGECGCHQKSSKSGIAQKPAQKSHGSHCGCSASKGKSHVSAHKGVAQRGSGIFQKSGPKSHHCDSKGKGGGCSTCCLAVIPALLNGVDHVLTSTVDHVLSTVFACNSCGHSSKSKSGGCGCSGKSSSKVGLPGTPPSNPFVDDELQPPPIPSTEARTRATRRPIHRQVTHTTTSAPVVRAEPRKLSIPTATAPLKTAEPVKLIRTVSATSPASLLPHNPLRAK